MLKEQRLILKVEAIYRHRRRVNDVSLRKEQHVDDIERGTYTPSRRGNESTLRRRNT
jgi:hypothetical protein